MLSGGMFSTVLLRFHLVTVCLSSPYKLTKHFTVADSPDFWANQKLFCKKENLADLLDNKEKEAPGMMTNQDTKN